MEALVRWRHPLRGLIYPDNFIPLAEDTGLIKPVGELVLRQACADAVQWPAHTKVSVNLSPFNSRVQAWQRTSRAFSGSLDYPRNGWSWRLRNRFL